MLNDIVVSYNPVAWVFRRILRDQSLLSKLSSYFSNVLIKNPSTNIEKLLFCVGLSALTYKIAIYMYSIIKNFHWIPGHLTNKFIFKVNRRQKFKEKYGDCYVLITGAADGIGYGYCWQFAKLGFNILMADIQQRKLFFRKQELTQTFPNIKVETFLVDMSDSKQIHQLMRKIQRFDIGIVVNNVGMVKIGQYLQIDPKLMLKTVIVNFQPMYEINRVLIPKLRNRKWRSAIINTSSSVGRYICQSVGAYSSSKFITDIYSRTISIQNRDKIDIIACRPFAVSTGMAGMLKQPGYISPRQCARATLQDLGCSDACFPGPTHKLIGSFFGMIPEDNLLETWDKFFKVSSKQAK